MADDPEAREDGEDLVVNLDEEDNPPEEKKLAPVPGPHASVPSVPQQPASQDGLAALQEQMNTVRQQSAQISEQNRRLAQERDQAIAFAQEAERRGVSTYELYNENQIKATVDRMEAMSAMAEQAMQDGDFKRAQSINLQIGRLGGNLAVLERDQQILVQQRENMGVRQQQQPQQTQPQQPQQPQSTDPMERAIRGRTEPTKQFLRKHPEIVRGDGTLKRSALDAHERALDEGFQVDTPGYFEFIERSLVAQEPRGNGHQQSRQSAPHVAAPVSRSSNGTGSLGGGSNEFRMTPKMRRLAEEQGVEPREWARNYVRLLNEGRITPIT